MNNKRKKKRSVNLTGVVILILIIISLILNICLHSSAVKKGAEEYTNAYNGAKNGVISDSHELFYQAAIDQYKTVSEMTTEISTENNEGILEVLRFNDVINVPQNLTDKTGAACYLSVPCSGVFTVDLNLSEFITDKQRNHVTVRIPRPELSALTIDFENVKLRNSSGVIISNSKATDPDSIQQQFEEDDPVLREAVLSNPVFADAAVQAAQKKISELIKAYNPFEDVSADTELLEQNNSAQEDYDKENVSDEEQNDAAAPDAEPQDNGSEQTD